MFKIIKDLSVFFSRHKRMTILSIVFLFFGVILTLPQPLLTKYLIDKVLLEDGNAHVLVIIIIILLGVTILRTVCSAVTDYCFSLLNEKIIFEIEIRLFRRFQYTSSNIHLWKKGVIQTRIKNDVASLGSVFIPSLVNAAKEILSLVTGLALIFYLNTNLAVVSILLYPVFIALMFYYNKKIRKVNAEYFEARSKTGGVLIECINLIHMFKSLSRDGYNIISFFKSSRKTFDTSVKRLRVSIENSLTLGFILSLIPIMVFAYGGYQVIIGVITLGTLVAFNSYLNFVYRPTSSLLNFNIGMQQAFSAWDRIQEVLNLPQERHEGSIIDQVSSISLQNVSFSYIDSKNVFERVNLNLHKGDSIGIIGESGSGKSTLSYCIMGILNPQFGEISVNSISIKDLHPIRWREHIGYIKQEPLLFNNTIYNNIAIGGRGIERDMVIDAAKKANIHDFIESLEMRYDTVLSEDALNISVGQKQRIALARALVKKPKLLILDEPTASVDMESERLICQSLEQYRNDSIMIIITHREPLLTLCDKIYCLKNQTLCCDEKYSVQT